MEIYVLKISDTMEEFATEQLNQLVPAFRRDMYQRYRNEADRERCLVAGVLLSYCMNEKGVSLEETPYFNKAGKLYFPGVDRFYVNLSHGGDYAVCAWDTEEIGVDMEPLRKFKEATAKRICTKTEAQSLSRYQQEEEKNQAFTILWTRKESVAKLLGEGIAVLFHADDLQALCEKEGICLQTYDSIPGYVISVASRKNVFPGDITVLSPEFLRQLHQQSH